jgi:hypothetical protein
MASPGPTEPSRPSGQARKPVHGVPDNRGMANLRDVALIAAACDSPFASHRIPTLQVAFAIALLADAAAPTASRAASQVFSGWAEQAAPVARASEGWWPSDLRLVVTAGHAGQRWRLQPGWMRTPADVTAAARDVAAWGPLWVSAHPIWSNSPSGTAMPR